MTDEPAATLLLARAHGSPMTNIEHADEIDDLKSKPKGELTESEHNRLRDLEAESGPTENTHRGAQRTGPRNNR